jgi:hypothetical protein
MMLLPLPEVCEPVLLQHILEPCLDQGMHLFSAPRSLLARAQQDILYVTQLLGRKNIKNTLVYTQLIQTKNDG